MLFPGWGTTRNQSRKFIDLMFEGSSYYPSPSPTKKFEVGDYGTVDPASGLFHSEGNIYTDGFEKLYGIVIEKPVTGAVENEVVYISKDGSKKKLDGEVGPSLPGNIGFAFKYSISFKNKRSALLAMIKPVLTEIPNQGKMRKLLDIPVLKGKAIVTEVYSCPAYASVLTSEKNGSASIGFTVQAPTHVPALSAGLEKLGSWEVNSSSGTWRHASDPEEKYCYYPLLGLRALGTHVGAVYLRDSPPPPPRDDDKLPKYYPPWGQLDDEEGEEIEFYDGDSDDWPEADTNAPPAKTD